MNPREDQAAGLRRLFRRAPPTVVALYATGRSRAATALLAAHRIAGQSRPVLLLDEAAGDASLAGALGLPDGPDLLSVLGSYVGLRDVLQPVPGLVGRVPVAAAALALPLLDEERRARLVGTLHELHRHAGFVLIHADAGTAGDPSPFVFAAPRRLIVAEADRPLAAELVHPPLKHRDRDVEDAHWLSSSAPENARSPARLSSSSRSRASCSGRARGRRWGTA